MCVLNRETSNEVTKETAPVLLDLFTLHDVEMRDEYQQNTATTKVYRLENNTNLLMEIQYIACYVRRNE